MQNVYKKLMLGVLCSSVLFLSACGDESDDNFIGFNPVQSYSIDDQVKAVVERHDIFTYKMDSVQHREIRATARVFTPKGTPPVGGWPIVVWAHGTTGGADQCAPSRLPLDEPEKALVMGLVQRGYAVIAPDYEGLGNDNVPHPYLNLESAANSILSAVNEAQQHYGGLLAKDWGVIGWSQGGHAALAAAEYHGALVNNTYRGAVAIAPASYLNDTLQEGLLFADNLAAGGNVAQAVPIAAALYTYTAIVSSGIKSEKTSFNYNQAFVDAKVNLASQAESLCAPELAQQFGADIQATLQTGATFSQYQALKDNFLADPDIANYLMDNQPAQTRLDRPVFIYQGTADTTVPYSITEILYDDMLGKGTDVELIAIPNATHSTVVIEHIAAILDTVDEVMATPVF
jgi:dipeptidyl aminopeptidase/acylaminoacyl peptidase